MNNGLASEIIIHQSIDQIVIGQVYGDINVHRHGKPKT
jgi:hypothetical protein